MKKQSEQKEVIQVEAKAKETRDKIQKELAEKEVKRKETEEKKTQLQASQKEEALKKAAEEEIASKVKEIKRQKDLELEKVMNKITSPRPVQMADEHVIIMSQQEAKNQLKQTVKETTKSLRKSFGGDMSKSQPQKSIHLGELLSQATHEQKELPSRGKNPTPVVHGDGANMDG